MKFGYDNSYIVDYLFTPNVSGNIFKTDCYPLNKKGFKKYFLYVWYGNDILSKRSNLPDILIKKQVHVSVIIIKC